MSIVDIIERWRTGGRTLAHSITVLDRTATHAGRDIRILADALAVAMEALNGVNSEVDMLCEEGPKLIGPEIALARIECVAKGDQERLKKETITLKPYLTIAVVFSFLFTSVQAQGLQSQIDACGQLSICKLDVPSGVTVVSRAWNLRDKTALSIKGQAGAVIIWHFDTDPPPSLCVDTTGTRNLLIEDVTFALGNTSKRPDVLWLHGRGADSKSQERLSVRNAGFTGWFNKSTAYFVAVENEEMHSVDFENSVPNTTALFLSRENELGVTSLFGPVRTGAMLTATNHLYQNCSFNHEGFVGLVPPATNDNGFGITLGTGVFDLLIQGGSTSGGARGGVLRIAGQGNRRIAVIAPNWESRHTKACIVVDGYAYGLNVDHGLLMADGPALRLNGTIENLSLQPAEMLCASIIKFGPLGKLTGTGLQTNGLGGL